ncbi:MAG: ATP synthase subunit I [Blastocatellia bacterium]
MDNVQHNEMIPDVAPDPVVLERRLRRITVALIVVGVVLAAALAGLKMALGFALGGALSLFNERWLSSSTKAMIEIASATGTPSVPRASKFVFRFLIIAMVMMFAMQSGYFHLLGIGLGFTTFVLASMVEAFYQLITFKN